MNTSSADATNISSPYPTSIDYRERLQQAVRVMQGLPEEQRANFDIDHWHRCIAGLCGRDPWFQERGFFSDDDTTLSMSEVRTFFGTDGPFRPTSYDKLGQFVTVDDAIAELNRAIEMVSDDAGTSSPGEHVRN